MLRRILRVRPIRSTVVPRPELVYGK